MRSVPVQSVLLLLLVQRHPVVPSPPAPPPQTHSRGIPFFAPGSLVILFPRRFSKFPRRAPPPGIVGFLSEICTVRLSSSGLSPFSLPPSSSTSFTRSGEQALSAEADMEMGRGDGPYEFRARSAPVPPSTGGAG
jgi:hypothetical protein